MATPVGNLMSKIIGAIAERLAADPSIPVENREAFRRTIISVFECEMADLFGGEHIKIYIPKIGGQRRQDRNERIAAAIEAGEAPEVIAKRENLTPRRVRQLRGSFGGNSRD
jgi:hypothetical protein